MRAGLPQVLISEGRNFRTHNRQLAILKSSLSPLTLFKDDNTWGYILILPCLYIQELGVMWPGLPLLLLKSLTLVGQWPRQEGLVGADMFLLIASA